MSVLTKGTTFATGDQVTATNLNAHVDNATFASGAVDGSTTQLSGGAIIVKDGGITSAKLDTNIQVAGTFGATGATTLSSTLAVTGAATAASFTATGVVKSSGATSGIGYATGAGSTVVQATNKSTGVTLNTMCGRITMNNASLADATTVGFTLTNSNIAVSDVVVLGMWSGGISTGSYLYWVDTIGSGTCIINIRNISGGSLAEAVPLTFVIIKGVVS